ncbi:MAG TPA: hypothetical protein VJS13_07370 [Pyrinomonadaceae bacterium]|nr:hypothetical protein [Pyrinomonadaceae bacterium]
MFVQAIRTELTAIRLLFSSKLTLLLLVLIYGALLGAGYLFVSTREATIAQLVVTFVLVIAAPVLFFALQAVSVNYVSGGTTVKRTVYDSLRLIAVSLPLIVLTALAFYGLGKIDSHQTVVTAVRYLLVGLIAPLLAIQLWRAASHDGLSSLLRRLHHLALRAFAPQSVFVYSLGILFFLVAPYLLIFHTTQTERAWLEVSLLVVRLAVSALLILFGWVTTVGTLTLLSKNRC